MVVHEGVGGSPPRVQASLERRRRTRKKSKRRASFGDRRASHRREGPTLYSALLHMLMALEPYRSPVYVTSAQDLLLTCTKRGRQRLDETGRYALEEAFNTVEVTLDHLFMPWVTAAHVYGRAGDYLDIPFCIDVLLGIERAEVAGLDPRERSYALRTMDSLLVLLGENRRRRTV